MAQVNSIREMFFEKGMNYADIARVTGHDVKTVKKYIYMENFNEPLPKPGEGPVAPSWTSIKSRLTAGWKQTSRSARSSATQLSHSSEGL